MNTLNQKHINKYNDLINIKTEKKTLMKGAIEILEPEIIIDEQGEFCLKYKVNIDIHPPLENINFNLNLKDIKQ